MRPSGDTATLCRAAIAGRRASRMRAIDAQRFASGTNGESSTSRREISSMTFAETADLLWRLPARSPQLGVRMNVT